MSQMLHVAEGFVRVDKGTTLRKSEGSRYTTKKNDVRHFVLCGRLNNAVHSHSSWSNNGNVDNAGLVGELQLQLAVAQGVIDTSHRWPELATSVGPWSWESRHLAAVWVSPLA